MEYSVPLDAGSRDRTRCSGRALLCVRTHHCAAGYRKENHTPTGRTCAAPARAHGKALERYFGCPVVCGATRNALVFRSSDAELPFITRNAELLDMLAPQFELELQQRTGQEDSFVELVRGAIQQKLTGHRPGIDDIAQDLRLSPRTLQRRLQELGSTYQRVLDEARQEMARYYLRNSVLELAEAAYLLGYEDANSFARAFRGWEGMPPKHWREANQGTAASATAARPN